MNGEKIVLSLPVSTHSRLKAAGTLVSYEGLSVATVSTHSRLKAAGSGKLMSIADSVGFQHTAA